MNEALIIARAVHFAASALAAGAVFFDVLVSAPVLDAARRLPPKLATYRKRSPWIVWLGLALAIVSGGAWLVLLAADILGTSVADACLHGGAWSVLGDTRFGKVWSGRALLVAALAFAAFPQLTEYFWNTVRLVTAAALLGSLAFVGHAGATPGLAGRFHLIADILHLLAAGLWLGALPPLALLLAHARNDRARAIAARIVRRFSLFGMIAVASLLASGLINAWYLVGSIRALFITAYGRLVALKIGLFVAMTGIAAVNQFSLTPRVAKTNAARALSRNALGELALGLCVMLFVGALGTMPPAAHIHFVPTEVPANAAFVHIHSEEGMAEVTIMPGRAGPAQAFIRLINESFAPLVANKVDLSLGAAATPATQVADGTWEVSGITVPKAGTVTVTVTITVAGHPPLVLDAPIVIEP